MHVASDENFELWMHPPGMAEIRFSNCTLEFTARVQEDGLGWAYNQVTDGACAVTPCAEGSGTKKGWAFGMLETIGIELAPFMLCVRWGGFEIQCTLATQIVTDGTHDYEFRAIGQRCSSNSTISVRTHWNIEGTPIAITHN